MPRVIGSALPKDTFIDFLLEFLEMLGFDPWNQRGYQRRGVEYPYGSTVRHPRPLVSHGGA